MIPNRFTRALTVAGLIGVVVMAVGAAFEPNRVWGNALVAAYFVATIGLGGAVFLALTTVTGARWHLGMRDIPRSLISLMPVGGIAVLGVLALQLSRYSWHHHGEGDGGTFWFKELWLSEPFFAVRAVAVVLLWVLFAKWISACSRRNNSNATSSRNGGVSALFLVVFALSISVAGWDWFMALEPLWFSTIWGVYHFSGLVTATLAVIVLLGVALRSHKGEHNHFTDNHLHDLGQLLFGFSCFWMYIWYSQYMLIWYTDIPEEAVYFVRRMYGAWGPVMAANILLNFGIPFLVLLPRPNKRSASVMTKVAVVVLIGRWVDLCLMVFPVTAGKTPVFGLWELAAVAVAAGLTVSFIPRPAATVRSSASIQGKLLT